MQIGFQYAGFEGFSEESNYGAGAASRRAPFDGDQRPNHEDPSGTLTMQRRGGIGGRQPDPEGPSDRRHP